jgi:thiol-disulfide isomerase/thioredoxin
MARRSSYFAILLGFALVSNALNIPEFYKAEGVEMLDKIEPNMNEHGILVEFFAPWCPHCQHYARTFVQIDKALKKKGIGMRAGAVDCTAQGKLAEKHRIRSYPALKLFKKQFQIPYNGNKDVKSVLAWLDTRSKDSMLKVVRTKAELQSVGNSEFPSVVASPCKPEEKVFTEKLTQLAEEGAVSEMLVYAIVPSEAQRELGLQPFRRRRLRRKKRSIASSGAGRFGRSAAPRLWFCPLLSHASKRRRRLLCWAS